MVFPWMALAKVKSEAESLNSNGTSINLEHHFMALGYSFRENKENDYVRNDKPLTGHQHGDGCPNPLSTWFPPWHTLEEKK